MSTNIFARTSQQTTSQTIQNKKNETAETAGSLAMYSEPSLLAVNTYDTVQFNNPMAVNIDFSSYANYDAGSDTSSGFLGGFANAVAVIGTDCSGFSGGDGGGCCSAGASSGSCGGGGGFTSFV